MVIFFSGFFTGVAVVAIVLAIVTLLILFFAKEEPEVMVKYSGREMTLDEYKTLAALGSGEIRKMNA